MSHKVVSIITPSFNRGYIVGETAVSIFNQTYPYWEWMVVDDGSSDNSLQILKEYAEKDPRVRIQTRDREPKGACTCRNIAVDNSTGDYVMFLDTDDLMAPFCLEQRVKAMEANPGCDFVIFPMLLFKKEPYDLNLLWNVETGEDDLMRVLKNDPVCQGTGPLWKKSSFQEVGMWRNDLKLWQDVELHIRSLLWPMKFAKRLDLQPDVFLRISDDSLSRIGFHQLPKLQSRVTVFEYACTKIQEKGLLNKYKEGLRVMGVDIMGNAIRSGHGKELAKLLSISSKGSLFSEKEMKSIKQYALVVKFKLSRFGLIRDFFAAPIARMTPQNPSRVGTCTFSKVTLKTTIQN
ncbi:MAG: glycosyltransferase family 2 protein [Verrucomicrobiales bacterium]|nr:glycosyltransferase family 2 protein [Verrucomicrobiales bacterium]